MADQQIEAKCRFAFMEPRSPTDLTPIPLRDLPPGLPDWMCALDAWAARTGESAQLKRATITVTVPTTARTWPPIA